MDNNEAAITAAAAGTIIFKSDGNFDRSCGLNGGNWNAVYPCSARFPGLDI